MHSKKLCRVEDITDQAVNLLLADEDKPTLKLNDVTLKRCLFIRLGLKNAEFRKVNFHQCVFEDCYFRRSTFYDVDFTGSFFKDCNLERASFEAARFWYVRFSRCNVNYDEILQSIPAEPSIAIPVLRSLRQNAMEMGEKKGAEKVLAHEIQAEKQELKNQILAPSEYYRKRFNALERFFSVFKFLAFMLVGYVLGHGLKLWNLLRSAGLCIVVFTILIFKFALFNTVGATEVPISLNLWQSLYLSFVTFTTLGSSDFTPTSTLAYIICAVESFLGVVFLGFLAATVYRKFSR